jgi:ammonium transporter, Amt family
MIDGGDTAWLLTSTVLVLMMTLPALGFFYAGLVQSKNTLSVLAQCVGVAALVSILWFVVGYSLAFSGTGLIVGDFRQVLLNAVGRHDIHAGTKIPESVYVMFQMTFAIITPALIIGAYVERMKFGAVLLFSALWLLVVYAPVTHWIWGGGWLAVRGVMDFAGGIVVHVTAGASALTIAWMLGPRQSFVHGAHPPHAPWMVMVGASLLWVGWFGFNAGSALSAGADAGMAMLATHLSAAAATLTWVAIEWLWFGKPSVVGAVTGTIAGLATITPASGYVGPEGAVLLGVLGGVICYGAVMLVKRAMRIDDALDVLGVHGVGGALGTLLLPFMVSLGAGGVALSRPALVQFSVQCEGVIAAAVWSVVATFVLVKLVSWMIGLRVDQEQETQGLDFSSHGETAYNLNS